MRIGSVRNISGMRHRQRRNNPHWRLNRRVPMTDGFDPVLDDATQHNVLVCQKHNRMRYYGCDWYSPREDLKIGDRFIQQNGGHWVYHESPCDICQNIGK